LHFLSLPAGLADERGTVSINKYLDTLFYVRFGGTKNSGAEFTQLHDQYRQLKERPRPVFQRSRDYGADPLDACRAQA
jgi:hypothetical protein